MLIPARENPAPTCLLASLARTAGTSVSHPCAPDRCKSWAPAYGRVDTGSGFGRVACGIEYLREIRRARFPVSSRCKPPGSQLGGERRLRHRGSRMSKPSRSDLALVALTWAMFVVSLWVWSGTPR